eukprot:366347-Chlamydomonas_euryale.AAC.9
MRGDAEAVPALCCTAMECSTGMQYRTSNVCLHPSRSQRQYSLAAVEHALPQDNRPFFGTSHHPPCQPATRARSYQTPAAARAASLARVRKRPGPARTCVWRLWELCGCVDVYGVCGNCVDVSTCMASVGTVWMCRRDMGDVAMHHVPQSGQLQRVAWTQPTQALPWHGPSQCGHCHGMDAADAGTAMARTQPMRAPR